MPGPPPKPRDQRVRRNRDEGTTSTSVVLSADHAVDWLGQVPVRTVEVEVPGEGPRLIPAPKTRWLQQTKQQWQAFWLAAESSMVRPHHLPSVERLFQLYDEEERIRRRVARSELRVRDDLVGIDGPARDGEVVVERVPRARRVPGHLGEGSQGQLVRGPDFDALMKLRSEIRQLEDRFAATPLAEFRVGWQQAAMLREQQQVREAQQIAEAASAIAERHQEMIEAES